MDSTDRRPQLPALSYLDIDQVKRDEDAYQRRNSVETPTFHAAATSPAYQFPTGPPPPYSQPAPPNTTAWLGGKPKGAHATPDSRQLGVEEKNHATKLPPRQSLPSISEALGVDSHGTLPPVASVAAPVQPPSQSHFPAPPSPHSVSRRAFGIEPPQPHNPYASTTHQAPASVRQDSVGPHPFSTPDLAKINGPMPPETSSWTPIHTSSHSDPNKPPPAKTYAVASPRHESTLPSAAAMAPPSFPYGYTSSTPKYAPSVSSATSSQSAGPVYQPSSHYGAPQNSPVTWKNDGAISSYRAEEPAQPGAGPYGDSVKRHLDLYDLEAALNEIFGVGGQMMDFYHRYSVKMHQQPRASGPSLASLPSIVEVDDLLHKSRLQTESLLKIRDVIAAQHAAYEQQLVDQQHQQQLMADRQQQQQQSAKAFSDSMNDPSTDDDGSGLGKHLVGFGTSDTKKRRGRAAPPGRCHSCNRAETPEWRRGPDGARTLCNACGLHYAKLTRKQTGTGKINGNNAASVGTSVGGSTPHGTAAATSSSLRPKE